MITMILFFAVLRFVETRKITQVAHSTGCISKPAADAKLNNVPKPSKLLAKILSTFNPASAFRFSPREMGFVIGGPALTTTSAKPGREWVSVNPCARAFAELVPSCHRVASPPNLQAADPNPEQTRALLPIWLAVFVQMLGVGVTISTVPLFLLSLGCSPKKIGITISCFSAAQMICCPLLVKLSNRPSTSKLSVLRMCLAGNAIASLLTARADGWSGVVMARILAGMSAASVPVAQTAVADVMPPGLATSKALTRVSSASSAGIVMGPVVGAVVAEVAQRFFGIHGHILQSRAVFGTSGTLALIVLLLSAGVRLPKTSATSEGGVGSNSSSSNQSTYPAAVMPNSLQLVNRWIALVCSMSVTTGIAIYALFGQQFLGYNQRELSISQSSAAAAALASQLFLLPRLMERIGEGLSCACGLTVLGLFFSAFSLLRMQPIHFMLFVAARAGHAVAEASNSALTAAASTPERRGRNLALLQSTQAGSRLFSPLIASYLYTWSSSGRVSLGPPGALPFLFVGVLALLTIPAPILVGRAVQRVRSANRTHE